MYPVDRNPNRTHQSVLNALDSSSQHSTAQQQAGVSPADIQEGPRAQATRGEELASPRERASDTESQETLSQGLKAAIAMFICGAASGIFWREFVALAIRILT